MVELLLTIGLITKKFKVRVASNLNTGFVLDLDGHINPIHSWVISDEGRGRILELSSNQEQELLDFQVER